MKKTIRLTESDLNRIVRRVILLEGIWGDLARAVQKLVTKSEDEIITALKSAEFAAAAKYMDDVVATAVKSKNLTSIGDLEAKLMHFYNPSGQQAGVAAAQEQVKKFLNAYSKSKGKANWGEIRNEVQGIRTPPKQPQSGAPKNPPPGTSKFNVLSGKRISNRSFTQNDIDFSKVSSGFKKPDGSVQYIKDLPNPMEEYNKMIAKAIETGDYQYISRKGFEKFGIDDFREFLKNNIDKVNEVDSKTGRWSVNFKPIQ